MARARALKPADIKKKIFVQKYLALKQLVILQASCIWTHGDLYDLTRLYHISQAQYVDGTDTGTHRGRPRGRAAEED